jgi:LysW-gamma-L-lysine carboxypeptidase
MTTDLLKRMLEIYSPSGQEAPLARFLCDEMTRRRFDVQLDSVGNVLGRIGRSGARVYLVGHMDTVSGEIPVRMEAGKLYGRGAVDAKGSLAAFIEAASTFHNSDRLSLTVIGCVGEEAASQGAHHLISQGHLESHGPHFVVVGEPSGWDAVTIGYKGSMTLLLRWEEERHHGGHAQPTVAERAVEFYQQLKAHYGARPLSFDSVDVRLRTLQTHGDGLHERAEMVLNLRTPVGFDFTALQQRIRHLGGAAEIEMGEVTAAFKADKQNGLVRSFLRAIRQAGGRPAFKVKTGTSDMNLFGPAWRVPILAYGPGDSMLDHRPREHVSLEEYERAVTVLRYALESLSSLHESQ